MGSRCQSLNGKSCILSEIVLTMWGMKLLTKLTEREAKELPLCSPLSVCFIPKQKWEAFFSIWLLGLHRALYEKVPTELLRAERHTFGRDAVVELRRVAVILGAGQLVVVRHEQQPGNQLSPAAASHCRLHRVVSLHKRLNQETIPKLTDTILQKRFHSNILTAAKVEFVLYQFPKLKKPLEYYIVLFFRKRSHDYCTIHC